MPVGLEKSVAHRICCTLQPLRPRTANVSVRSIQRCGRRCCLTSPAAVPPRLEGYWKPQHLRPSSNQRCRVRAEESGRQAGASTAFESLQALTTTTFYRVWLQAAVVFVVLGIIDAAYSGDWSRIGAISKATEEQLKRVVMLIGLVHIVCAPTAAVVAARRGDDWVPAFGKTAAVGFLSLVEVLLKPQSNSSR